ncbi:MAG: hypothetical protein KKC21_02065 [Nitrospinae bacterium]|nr:hypothetical protein [Nitrospinota bacterium]
MIKKFLENLADFVRFDLGFDKNTLKSLICILIFLGLYYLVGGRIAFAISMFAFFIYNLYIQPSKDKETVAAMWGAAFMWAIMFVLLASIGFF